MAELREKMIPFLNKRVQVRGTLTTYGSWTKNYRDVGRACISHPEINFEIVAHHVWVMDVRHWPRSKDAIGAQVEFDAVVTDYTDKDGKRNYSLSNPDDLHVLHPPSVPIPDLPPEDDGPPEETPPEDECPSQATQIVADPLQMMRQVKSFAKACGGLEPAERVATALRDMTIPLVDLIAWLKELREE